MPIPFELTQDQLAALGRITATFATLEHVVRRQIGFFLDEDPWIGEILGTALPFERSLNVLDALVRYRTEDEAILKQVGTAIAAASEAAAVRNQLIHSRWSTDFPPAGTATRIKVALKRGSGVKPTIETVRLEELHEIADQIDDAVYQVSALFEPLGKAAVLKGVSFG